MLTSGYVQTRIPVNRLLITPLHTWLGYLFTAIFVFHFLLSVFVVRYPWRKTFLRIIRGEADSNTLLRFTQRISGWLLLAVSLVLVVSGLRWYNLGFFRRLSFNPHVRVDVLMSISLIIHVGISSKIALRRARIVLPSINLLIVSGMLFLLLTGVYIDGTLGQVEKETGDPDISSEPDIPDIPVAPSDPENPIDQGEEKPPGSAPPLPSIEYDTRPEREGRIRVGSETYTFNPDNVNTTRPDIFNPGYFSMFDVLVHVAEKEYIDLEYHFDESMNTHVVDSIDGEEDWWYMAFYDGGWSENNFFRPDHYPWKDGTTLRFFKVKRDTLDLAYDIFRKEVARKRGMEGKVVIPRVVIDGPATQ
jgi:hypothetical protein